MLAFGFSAALLMALGFCFVSPTTLARTDLVIVSVAGAEFGAMVFSIVFCVVCGAMDSSSMRCATRTTSPIATRASLPSMRAFMGASGAPNSMKFGANLLITRLPYFSTSRFSRGRSPRILLSDSMRIVP